MLKLLYHHIFIISDNNKLKKVWKKILLLYKIDILLLKIFKFKKYHNIFNLFKLFISKPYMLIIYVKRKMNI